MLVFEMGDTLNYKKWAIKVEIARLKKLNKHFKNSDQFMSRLERIHSLERDLKDFDTEEES